MTSSTQTRRANSGSGRSRDKGRIHLPLFMQTQMGLSRHAAASAIPGGRAYLDGRCLTASTLPLSDVQGKTLRVGKVEMIVLGQNLGRAPNEQLSLG